MFEASGPVPAFTDAVQARDLNRVASLLAHDVVLSVPPLHLTCRGTQDVLGAVMALLQGFGELRYDVRSRYLAPGAVTDEAMIVGRQTGYFLGAEPTRRISSVAARVIITHDSATVTAITVWPDLAALHEATSGLDRVIDLTRVGQAGGMVAALRATIPPAQSRVILGHSRDLALPAEALLGTGPVPPGAGTEAGSRTDPRIAPKPPVPRNVRRRRAFIAGTSMLAASTAITIWVGAGALHAPGGGGPTTRAGANIAPSGANSSQAGAAANRAAGAAGRSGVGDGSKAGAGSTSDPARSGARGQSGAAGAQGRTGTDGGSAASTSGTGAAGSSPGVDVASALPATLTPDAAGVSLQSDLLFDTGSYTLNANAKKVLGQLIKAARAQHRKGKVDVYGYTDSVGSEAYNKSLSKNRAHAVAVALRDQLGREGMTFTSHGQGEADPVATNDTVAGRKLNRRVTVIFEHPTPPAPRSL